MGWIDLPTTPGRFDTKCVSAPTTSQSAARGARLPRKSFVKRAWKKWVFQVTNNRSRATPLRPKGTRPIARLFSARSPGVAQRIA